MIDNNLRRPKEREHLFDCVIYSKMISIFFSVQIVPYCETQVGLPVVFNAEERSIYRARVWL